MLCSQALAVVVVGLVGLVMPQSIDPSKIPEATKEKWCTDQKSSCPLLCLQIKGATTVPRQNSCTPSTLAYSCVCSNGQSPNASEYSQTIPYYECTETANNCVSNCAAGDSSCQSACRNDHLCGAQNPPRVNITSSSTSASATATSQYGKSTGQNIYTGVGGSPSSTGTSNASGKAENLVLGLGQQYGLAVMVAALGTGFFFGL